MAESPLLDKVPLDLWSNINANDKASNFINGTKGWKLGELHHLPPSHIVEMIGNSPILVLDVQDRIIWKYSADGSFSIKTATWTYNDKILPLPRSKLLNRIWKLNIIPKSKFFVWKLIRCKIPTRDYIRRFRIDINVDCHFYYNYIEDIDHLYINCKFSHHFWNTISYYCPNPTNSSLHFIGWIKFIQKYEKVYQRIFGKPLEKIAAITWSIWIHRNNSIFRS